MGGASEPRLTVGVPVYNGGAYLAETLRGILDQSFTDFELIISDNASTDATETISRSFVEADPRVRYHRNATNLGLTRNYNQLVSMGRGEFFKWASADDVTRPAYLEKCVEVLDRQPDVVLAYSRTRFVDASGRALDIQDPGWDLHSDAPHERLRYVIYAGHWVNSILGTIRRSALLRTRLMPGYPGGDYCLLGELSLIGKFYEVPEELYWRRLHPGSSSQHTTSPRWLAEYYRGGGGRLPLPAWNRGFDHLRTVLGSGLPARHKFSLSGAVLRTMWLGRRRLWREVLAAIPHRPAS